MSLVRFAAMNLARFLRAAAENEKGVLFSRGPACLVFGALPVLHARAVASAPGAAYSCVHQHAWGIDSMSVYVLN